VLTNSGETLADLDPTLLLNLSSRHDSKLWRKRYIVRFLISSPPLADPLPRVRFRDRRSTEGPLTP
jgi:hypothetical protein